MKPIVEDNDITNIPDTVQLRSPPWLPKQPVVILDLNKLPKNKTHPLTYQENFFNIHEKYQNYSYIYTDGSKDSNRTRFGAVLNKKMMKKCLPNEASIFTTEICAINLVLQIVDTNNIKKFVIHSDSISVLQSIKNANQNKPLIVKLLNKLNTIRHSKKGILCWIPSHIGIQGNEKADSLAKAALNMTPDQNAKIPYTDLKHKIKTTMTQKWQQLKDKNTHNKLYQIEPILKERKLNPNNTRRKKPTLAQLHIGHTRQTHSFILKEEPPPKCYCENQYTVKHILRIHNSHTHSKKVLQY